ncbi:efflux RND transporter periplasmic adaptor subunit [Alkalicaulis satelles]|uniref:Efflux RND transporter periplasmic adaptor subunit n=1 Tax=Alkalicaulis satelles TaxID=2609175 RepID=A0A5M6ZIC0_9PROT|nr:efflux RND transporter periplasmic adaptor subunit [Alkalicaulis satelles]KAA5803564.1 efflux RND transporter periplasmic adaptor subunit [Alkalicaulis satelles]
MSEDRRDQLRSLSIDRNEETGRSGGGISLPVLLGAIIMSAALAGGAAWYLLQGGAGETPAAPVQTAQAPANANATGSVSPAAETSAPARAPRASGLIASGYVVARRQATVSAEITGRIAEVLVEEGTRVDAGEVLARLDDTRARLDLDLIESQIHAAQARVRSLDFQAREAVRVSDRASRLFERDIAAEATVTAAQAQQASLQAQLRAAQAELDSARVRLSSQQDLIARHTVRAPFAGVVIAKNAQVGEILFPGSAGGGFTRTGVATLVDMDSLEIEVDVNEGQIQRVTPGQRVETVLDAYPDWRIASRVEAIIPTADRSRATIKVRVALEERDARILPDMAARVTFIE